MKDHSLTKAGKIVWFVSWLAIVIFYLNEYSGDFVYVMLIVVASAFPALIPAVLAGVIFPDKE